MSTEKSYPLNYAESAIRFIEAMTIGERPKIMGSMANKTQLYAGDYDLLEIVKTDYKRQPGVKIAGRLADVVKQLLKTPNCYIGDIKCGEVAEWNVLAGVSLRNNRIMGYDQDRVLKTLERVPESLKTDSDKELLPKHLTPAVYFEALDRFKYHTVRWTPKEMIDGEKTLADGRRYTVAEGVTTNSLTKIDIVGWVGDRYSEFSCIYVFENNGKILNDPEIDPQNDLRESLCYYKSAGNYFKMAKRYYSIAKLSDDKITIEKLNGLLNSDLGRLYSIVSDIATLLFLMEERERLSIEKVRAELEGFRVRLANVYTVKGADSNGVLKQIASLEDLPADEEGKKKLREALTKLSDFFTTLLNRYTKKQLLTLGLIPIKKQYGGC